jgi:hypothetical protein
MAYTVVFNRPGYLPESDPTYVETIYEARKVVVAYIDSAHDVWHEGDCEEDAGWFRVREDAQKLSKEGDVLHMPDGYVADVTVC